MVITKSDVSKNDEVLKAEHFVLKLSIKYHLLSKNAVILAKSLKLSQLQNYKITLKSRQKMLAKISKMMIDVSMYFLTILQF